MYRQDRHDRPPGGRRVAAGLAAGILGSIPAALILWGAWMLPLLGLVLTRVSLWRGVTSVVAVGALGGYHGLAVGAFQLPLAASALAGLGYGVLVWVGMALVLIPVLYGMPPFPASPADQLPALGAFGAYGITMALLYSAFVGPQALRADRGLRLGPDASRRRSRRVALALSLGVVIVSGMTGVVLLRGARTTDPAALVLPDGYEAQVVAEGFTYPTCLAVSGDGTVYVGEAGYSYGPKATVARVMAVTPDGDVTEVARGFDGPLNGLALHDGELYVSHRGRVTAIPGVPAAGADGEDGAGGEGGEGGEGRRDVVRGLPSLGDHQNNDIEFGPDGLMYLGQGTATNAGVVGWDNFIYAWADRYQDFCDVPSRDWVLTGVEYQDLDLRTPNPADHVTTGAFMPFGVGAGEGTRLKAVPLAGGTVLQIDPATGETRVFADGLRNPYGLAFGRDGALYATNLGYDDRGVRAVKGSPDWVVQVREGAWYGWPDYAGARPLSDPVFASRRSPAVSPLIASPPAVEAPLAELPAHSSPMHLDVSPGGEFGDPGGLYVPVFGDADPVVEDLSQPVATGILRVDPVSGEARPFLLNREGQRAARYGEGIKRAIACQFARDGSALYVLDFGQLETTDLAPNAIPRTGVLWRIVFRGAGP